MKRCALLVLAPLALAACEHAPLQPDASPSDAARAAVTGAPAIQNIGSLGGGFGWARGINDRGQVVGVSYNRVGASRAFVWSETAGMRELPTLGGWTSWGNDINEDGVVVGSADLPMYDGTRAFRWTEAGGMENLGTLGGGSYATGINAAGFVTGYSEVGTGAINHAFLWNPTTRTMVDIAPLEPLHVFAHGINDRGQIVGTIYKGGIRAFVWSAATGVVVLPTLGGTYAEASGINNHGVVTGWSETADRKYHAFVWTPTGGIKDIGTLGGAFSQARAIGDDGSVVGWSDKGDTTGMHAFAWSEEKGMRDLGIHPGQGSYALAVNGKGMAAGWTSPPWDHRASVVFRFEPGTIPPPDGGGCSGNNGGGNNTGSTGNGGNNGGGNNTGGTGCGCPNGGGNNGGGNNTGAGNNGGGNNTGANGCGNGNGNNGGGNGNGNAGTTATPPATTPKSRPGGRTPIPLPTRGPGMRVPLTGGGRTKPAAPSVAHLPTMRAETRTVA